MARRNGPRLLKVLAAGAAASAGLVAALCSAGVPALASARPVAAPASLPSCSIVPSWTVRSALDQDAQAPVETHPVPSGTTCTYSVGTNSLGVQVTFLEVPWPAFQAVEQDYLKSGAIKVYGVGQPAFAVASRTTTYENLFFYGDGYNMGITAEAPLPKMVDLAKAVLARLQ
jgi:hypothetical protein